MPCPHAWVDRAQCFQLPGARYGITDDTTGPRRAPRPATHGCSSAVPLSSTPNGTASSAAATMPSARPLPWRGGRPSAALSTRCTGPRTFRQRGRTETDEVEVAASHQKDHTACREHGPESVQPSPRPGHRHRQRPEELDGDRDPQRDPGQRQVEAQVHQAENHAVAEHDCPRAAIHAQ